MCGVAVATLDVRVVVGRVETHELRAVRPTVAVRATRAAQTVLEVLRHDTVDDRVDAALDVGQQVDRQLEEATNRHSLSHLFTRNFVIT